MVARLLLRRLVGPLTLWDEADGGAWDGPREVASCEDHAAMVPAERSSLDSIIFAIIGVGALTVSIIAAFVAVGFGGGPDDVILVFEGREVDDTAQRVISGAIAVVLGAAGIACLLRWRDRRHKP